MTRINRNFLSPNSRSKKTPFKRPPAKCSLRPAGSSASATTRSAVHAPDFAAISGHRAFVRQIRPPVRRQRHDLVARAVARGKNIPRRRERAQGPRVLTPIHTGFKEQIEMVRFRGITRMMEHGKPQRAQILRHNPSPPRLHTPSKRISRLIVRRRLERSSRTFLQPAPESLCS